MSWWGRKADGASELRANDMNEGLCIGVIRVILRAPLLPFVEDPRLQHRNPFASNSVISRQ